jgi:hypothetical protein
MKGSEVERIKRMVRNALEDIGFKTGEFDVENRINSEPTDWFSIKLKMKEKNRRKKKGHYHCDFCSTAIPDHIDECSKCGVMYE